MMFLAAWKIIVASSNFALVESACWYEPDAHGHVIVPGGITEIPAYAFDACQTLVSITIPEGVTIFKERAFQNTDALISINIPSTVTTIRRWTFRGSGIRSINIPVGVKIEHQAFINNGCGDGGNNEHFFPGKTTCDCIIVDADICPPTSSVPTNIFSDVPSSIPTSSVTSTPTKVPSKAPSALTLIETIHNYTIVLEDLSFDSFDFILTTTYTMSDISHAFESKVTIMDTGCNLTYGGQVPGESINDTLPVISEGGTSFLAPSISKSFQLDKFALKNSILTSAVSNFDKSIAGEVNFCLKAEIVIGGMVINFRESIIALGYDLSTNSFSIIENNIEKEIAVKFTENTSNIYSIEACRCGVSSYNCLTLIERSKSLDQNSLVNVCLKPNSTDVRISELYMTFYKDGTSEVAFEAVKNSTGAPGLSSVQGSGTTSAPLKVTSRLIGMLFEKNAKKFDIKGTTYLQFVMSSRKLNIRSSDQTLQQEEGNAGTAQYEISVPITRRNISEMDDDTGTFFGITVAGGFLLLLAIALMIHKKIS